MRKRYVIGGVIVALLAVLYFSGRMDSALYNVGLNFHPCLKNGYGAVFCGQDAKSYCSELDSSGVNGINSVSAQSCQKIGDSAAVSAPVTTDCVAAGNCTRTDPYSGAPCDPSLPITSTDACSPNIAVPAGDGKMNGHTKKGRSCEVGITPNCIYDGG